VERPRSLAHAEGPLDQGHALVTAQKPRQAEHPAARATRRSPARQQGDVPRLPAQGGTPRPLYQLEDRALAPALLDAWLAWASRSRLAPFIKLARTIRRHQAGILAAIRLGLSNGRLEGLNSRIRLISHRSFGFHSADPLIALVYLCCSRIVIDLPR